MRLNLGVPLRALQERLDAVENECRLLASLKTEEQDQIAHLQSRLHALAQAVSELPEVFQEALKEVAAQQARVEANVTSNSSVASSPAGAVENLASAGAAASIFPCYPGDANCGGRDMRRGAASGDSEEDSSPRETCSSSARDSRLDSCFQGGRLLQSHGLSSLNSFSSLTPAFTHDEHRYDTLLRKTTNG